MKLWLSMLMTIPVLFTLIALAISIMVLTWIHKLEEISCKCSEDFKRDYIKYFLYINICLLALGPIVLTVLMMYIKSFTPDSLIFKIGTNLFYIAGLLNCIFAIMYIYRLKETDCKCSEDVRREIYYVLNWIYIAFVALMVLLIILIAVLGPFFAYLFMRGVQSQNSLGSMSRRSSLRSKSR